MSEGNFFTFSLPLLAMPLPEKDILDYIVSHSVCRAGSSSSADDIPQRVISETVKQQKLTGFNRRNDRHGKAVRGAIICNVNIGSIHGILDRCDTVNRFIAEHEAKYGASPLVFISSDLLWGCKNVDFPTYREFSTLCAINSITGMKRDSPVLIRRQMIIARQMGYKTPKVMQAEQPTFADGRKPLSTQPLRDTLDALEGRSLISRCQASPRNVYFSTGMTYPELKAAVDAIKLKRSVAAFRRQIERGETK